VRAWILVASLLVSAMARADAESCVAASDEGQKLRDEGRLRAARDKLVSCAAEECPSPVRGDCVRWLDDVDRRMPSVVIAATANGKDATEVSVSIDGAVAAEHLDGQAIRLDPGKHTLRYEHAGDSPQEETILLREGEKDRSLRVSFGHAPPPLVALPKKPPTLAYTMTGVAIGGAIGFGVFALAGYLTIQGCDDKCRADGAMVDSHRTQTLAEFVVADISLAVAIVSAGIATWAFIRHARAPAPMTTGVRLDLARGALAF
jgi:hypothetical protein